MTQDGSLWRLLGRREAFGMVAARCSAAEATQIKEIRDSKAYLEAAADWPGFSRKFLHMSYDSANRIIRNLEEFGPGYFEVAQFTRISAATYRAIAPSIRDGSLHHNGEAIALIPENAAQVAAAVAELRKTETVKAAVVEPQPDPILALEESSSELVAKIEGAVARREQRESVRAVICSLRDRLSRIALTL